MKHALWMRTKGGYTPEAPTGWKFHVTAWNKLPSKLALGAIERVILSDDDMKRPPMPTVLRQLPNVRSLSTEPWLLDFAPADFPKLAELQIGGTSESVLPAGPWPKLRSVLARDARLALTNAADFPALTEIEALTKGTKSVFDAIVALPKLRKLQIGPVKDEATLAMFAALPLTAFAINRGSVKSLAPLAKSKTITSFGAMNCHTFADLAPLAKMPALREVWFNTCAGIKKPNTLLDMPKLKDVTFWGCRDNGGVITKVCKALLARGVKVDSELLDDDDDD